MSIFIGSTEITDIQIGSTAINSVYVGADKVWDRVVSLDMQTVTVGTNTISTILWWGYDGGSVPGSRRRVKLESVLAQANSFAGEDLSLESLADGRYPYRQFNMNLTRDMEIEGSDEPRNVCSSQQYKTTLKRKSVNSHRTSLPICIICCASQKQSVWNSTTARESLKYSCHNRNFFPLLRMSMSVK